MSERPRKRPIDWGHIAFLAVVAAVTGVYLLDVVSVSTHLNNIILVAPLALALIALVAILAVVALRGDCAAPPPEDASAQQSGGDLAGALILLAGLGVYVSCYQLIGLDVATFAFVAGGLLLLGVRGWVFVPVFSAIFTVIVVGGADLMLYYPMYTAILP